jgi:uncharacterized protein (TIGR02996 family)
VTTLNPDLLAHLAAVRDKPEPDDTDLLVLADHLAEAGDEDRAVLLRAQVELSRTPMFHGECKVCAATPDEEGWIRHGKGCYVVDSDGGGEEPADRNPDWEALRARERDLLARNPAWLSAKCSGCLGDNTEDFPPGDPLRCVLCNGSGDVLRPKGGGFLDLDTPTRRAAVTRGFLDLTLPHTLCWRECSACRGEGEITTSHRADCYRCRTTGIEPHPVLRAVLASPAGPWVRRVRVEDNDNLLELMSEADFAPGGGYETIYRYVFLPEPIQELVGRRHPTAAAATDALARAVPIWARSAK